MTVQVPRCCHSDRHAAVLPRGREGSHPSSTAALLLPSLTLSFSERRSSSLISFSLASRIACLVTERMASWGNMEGQDARPGAAGTPQLAPGSTHPAAVAEPFDLLHAELVGKQDGGPALCAEGSSEPPHPSLGRQPGIPPAMSLSYTHAARNPGVTNTHARRSWML